MKSENDATVLLAERSFSGHRLGYVRLLAEEALRRNHRVHIALPIGGAESEEFKTHLGHLSERVDLTALPKFDLQALETFSRAVNANRVVVSDGDLLAVQLAKAGSWRGTGRLSILIMREHAQPDKSAFKMWMKNRAKHLIHRRVSSLTGVDLAILKSSLWKGTSRLRVAIDPVQIQCTEADIARIREDWNLDSSTYWFAVLGAITERKNVPLIAESLSFINQDKIGLLIAGKIESQLRSDIENSISQLMTSGKSAKVIDRLLTDAELDAAVSTADCLVLAHSNEGPSGLLGKAAAAGTRVVASGASSLRTDVLALGASAQWTPLELQPLSIALDSAADLPLERKIPPRTTSSFLEVLLPND